MKQELIKNIKITLFQRYGFFGASSRLRSHQFVGYFENEGMIVRQSALIPDIYLLSSYNNNAKPYMSLIKSYCNRIKLLLSLNNCRLIWIEKELLPFFPLWLELLLIRKTPYVLDYDDAVFHNYDRHPFGPIRMLYGKRLDGLMARANLVICGNEYLADRAKNAGAKWIEILPTVIDIEKYSIPLSSKNKHESTPVRIVWIGSPSTVKYLNLIQNVLLDISTRYDFILRIIGAEHQMDGIQIEYVKWTEETEVKSISDCDVGLMPLFDSPWERGKCGYKLIQYMACGLPVVASDVGVNSEIVQDEVNGFLARSTKDWIHSLERLLIDAEMRKRMGKAGRQRVEDEYCIQKTGPKLAGLLKQVAEGR